MDSQKTETYKQKQKNAKNLARFGAVLYLAAVFFVVFHNTGFQLEGLLEARFLTMLLMGVIAFIAILQVIKEEDEPSDEL